MPGGYPFPDGLTGLPNLIVQSNLSALDPIIPSPRGVEGLLALSDGFLDVVSNVVFPNFPEDSLDLIFTDAKSGVGFNTLTFGGEAFVCVQVYSTTNVFLGIMLSPSDPKGDNFIGVWSPTPIGRINIGHSAGFGLESGENIQAWQAPPPCPSDLDGNGTVGASDLLTLLANWGPCP